MAAVIYIKQTQGYLLKANSHLHFKIPFHAEFSAKYYPVFVTFQSAIGNVRVNLHFIVAGFLGVKCLAVIFLLIIGWSQKNRRLEDGSRRENEHQLLSVTGDTHH